MRFFLSLFLACGTAGSVYAQVLPGLTITGQSFVYDAPDGRVTGTLRLPASAGPWPAMLLSHGRGGTAANINAQHGSVFVTWGVACIAVDYTHAGSAANLPSHEGYCPENSRRARRALEILVATPGVDFTRLALFGHSMGAFVTAGLCGELTTQVRAACLSAGGTSGTSDSGVASPALPEVAAITAPLLMFHGALDATVPPGQSATLHTLLTAGGVPARRLLYAGVGHDIIRVKQTDVHALWRAWLTEHGVLAYPENTTPALTAPAAVVVAAGTAGEVALALSDAESAATALTLQVFTTDDARLPSTALVWGGTEAARTLTLQPPASGLPATVVDVWLVAHDGALATAVPLAVTITPGEPPATTVQHRPEISWIADQRTTPGVPVAGVEFTVGDVETGAANLVVTAVSSQPALLPASGLVLGGSGARRTLTLVPAAGQTGAATITVTVSDGGQTTATAFALTVAPAVAGNTPPLVQALADAVVPAGSEVGPLAFVVRDAESAENTLTVTALSSDPSLVPAGAITLGGTAWGRTVRVVPAAGASGRVTLTLTVSDGVLASSTAFVVDVIAAGTPPMLTALPSVHTAILGAAPETIGFHVADAETASADLRVTAMASNPTLLPAAGLVLGGNGAERTLTVTPAAGQTGATTITLAVSDGTFQQSAELLWVVHDPAAPAAQFSRPRGLYVLDSAAPAASYTTTFGSTISLRDGNVRAHPFVAGFTLRVAWRDVESGTTPGAYDFFIVQNALAKLPAGQRLSLILVPPEPAYLPALPGVQTWSDGGTLRATPWDPTLRARRRALLQALAAAPVGAGGVALRDDPRLDVVDPYLPGGFTGIRDPNTTPLRDLPGYSRAALLGAVQDELRTWQDVLPGRFVQLGFWPVTDGQDAAFGGVSAAEWLRTALLAEFDGRLRPRVGFFMENLAAKRPGPGLAPASSTPVTGFAAALFGSRDATWTAFQMLGSWVRPFNDSHVTNTLYGAPADALEAAFNTYRSEYAEVYVSDVDHPAFQPALQRWHDFFARAVTTAPHSDEDGDGLPLAWEQAHGLDPLRPDAADDDTTDGDGLPLLFEYAFAQDPRAPSPEAWPVAGVVFDATEGGSYFTLTFLRRTDDARLRYTVEASADLGTWQSGPEVAEQLSATPGADGVSERVTMRLRPALGTPGARVFGRVTVTVP